MIDVDLPSLQSIQLGDSAFEGEGYESYPLLSELKIELYDMIDYSSYKTYILQFYSIWFQ